MHVVATAGHVDHGKSTLVRALTGMEPDRWAEERRRGMTIDLGYAWTTLPSGRVLGLVDVPGHARFIGNLLAGLGPAPAVLLVVAADEGWRRQSGEHLAAIHALGLTSGVLAVTRCDLADPAPATAAALEHVARSSLRDVQAVPVSARTGAGLDDLRDVLDRLARAQPEPDTAAPVRLWVDRAFTVRGSGTVATGTLTAGTLRGGDELLLRGRAVRVRRLHSLGEAYGEVAAQARVAVNLRGVEPSDVGRGDALLTPGQWQEVDTIDVRLTAPAVQTLPAQLLLHLGSAAVPVRLRPLGEDVARLHLARPVAVRRDDRALLRDPAAQVVAAGVSVLDVGPPALPRRRGAAAARAQALQHGVAQSQVAGARPALVRRLRDLVQEHAARSPLEDGVPDAVAARELGLRDLRLLSGLAADAGLFRSGGRVRLARQHDLGPAEEAVRTIESRLQEDPFAAPDGSDLSTLRLGPREIAAAERAGRLLRLGRDVVLLPDAPRRAVERLAGLPQPFTLAAARSALGTSRRVALPLLEHLDRQGATRRLDGHLREMRRP